MRYKLITQKPYCCVPACLQMIFRRRKMKMMDQEKIGWHLGLIVPKSGKKYFRNDILFGKGIYGHVTLVSRINNRKIMLADPNLPKARNKKVSIKKLLNAMRIHNKIVRMQWEASG